jgi:hypothetical protein
LESRPGLAPGKERVAAVRLDGFGMRLMNGASGRSCTCIGRFTGPVLGLFQARWQDWHSRHGRGQPLGAMADAIGLAPAVSSVSRPGNGGVGGSCNLTKPDQKSDAGLLWLRLRGKWCSRQDSHPHCRRPRRRASVAACQRLGYASDWCPREDSNLQPCTRPVLPAYKAVALPIELLGR